jgi:transcription antitermination factor NusG
MPVTSVTCRAVVRDWPAGFAAALPDGPWIVAHVRPRGEAALAAGLHRSGVAGLVLYEERRRRYAGKGSQVGLVPMLGGYVFVSANRDQADAIYRTERVVRLINPPRPEVLAAELRALVALVGLATGPVVVRPELVPGTPVEIGTGTFAGLRAVVLRRQNATEIVVNIELLGQSVSTRVPVDTVL